MLNLIDDQVHSLSSNVLTVKRLKSTTIHEYSVLFYHPFLSSNIICCIGFPTNSCII